MANPPNPGLFEKINFIIKWIWDPCDAPVEIYAQAALPALLKAFITYLTPDWYDILTSFVRPRVAMRRVRGARKGGRGKRHGRWAKGYAWTKFLDFDTSEFIAKKLPGFDEFGGRHVSNGVVHLWTIFGLLERVNFYWFIVNLVITFFFDWMSQILKIGYCEEMGKAVLRAHNDGLIGHPLFGWVGSLMPIIDKQRGPVTWNLATGSITAFTAVVVFSGTCKNNNAVPCQAALRVTQINGPLSGLRDLAIVDLLPDGIATVTVSITIRGPCQWTVEDWCDGGPIDWSDMACSMMSEEKVT